MPAPDASPTSSAPAASPAPAAPKPRRSLGGLLLRLLFGGKRAIVTVPVLLLGGWIGWKSMVYAWYRGASHGERTGVIVKVSRKGSPLCRYESVEMRVGQQVGATVLGADLWEFTVDGAYSWLIPQLEEAGRKQVPVTVKYRQDTFDVGNKTSPAPNNLPWNYCVETSYHATGVITSK